MSEMNRNTLFVTTAAVSLVAYALAALAYWKGSSLATDQELSRLTSL